MDIRNSKQNIIAQKDCSGVNFGYVTNIVRGRLDIPPSVIQNKHSIVAYDGDEDLDKDLGRDTKEKKYNSLSTSNYFKTTPVDKSLGEEGYYCIEASDCGYGEFFYDNYGRAKQKRTDNIKILDKEVDTSSRFSDESIFKYYVSPNNKLYSRFKNAVNKYYLGKAAYYPVQSFFRDFADGLCEIVESPGKRLFGIRTDVDFYKAKEDGKLDIEDYLKRHHQEEDDFIKNDTNYLTYFNTKWNEEIHGKKTRLNILEKLGLTYKESYYYDCKWFKKRRYESLAKLVAKIYANGGKVPDFCKTYDDLIHYFSIKDSSSLTHISDSKEIKNVYDDTNIPFDLSDDYAKAIGAKNYKEIPEATVMDDEKEYCGNTVGKLMEELLYDQYYDENGVIKELFKGQYADMDIIKEAVTLEFWVHIGKNKGDFYSSFIDTQYVIEECLNEYTSKPVQVTEECELIGKGALRKNNLIIVPNGGYITKEVIDYMKQYKEKTGVELKIRSELY